MNVLSLFDGISCAREALRLANIPVNKYYCCEIDKWAIQVSKKNWNDNIHLGSVVDFSNTLLDIELLIGGSPCQDLSIAKKDRKGLDGNRSGLFWHYVRIKDLLKPKYFILENVASMPQKDKDIITEVMGVEPIMFNASLVSAQCRKRLFWTNIKFDLPEDKGILLKHILQNDTEIDKVMIVKEKTFTKTAQTGRNETKKLGFINDIDHQANRVYDINGKLPALNAICNSRVNDTSKFKQIGHIVKLGQKHEVNNTHGAQANRVYSAEAKSPTLNQSSLLIKLEDIRKLTPIECERLQSLPDDYTECVSKSQRYKCLGNAFNCEVIAHILKNK